MKRNMLISASKLDTFGLCERKFNFSQIMNLRLKDVSELNLKADMGSLFHKMLELHYTLKHRGKDFTDMVFFTMSFGRWYGMSRYPSINEEKLELVVKSYKEYAFHYRDETYVVDQDEDGKPMVEVPFAKIIFEDDNLRIIIEGIIDFLGSNNDHKIVVDHKTGATVPYSLMNQFQLYSIVDDNRDYVVANRVIFDEKVPERKFIRVPFTYSKSLKKLWLDSIVSKAMRIDNAFRKGEFEPNFSSCYEWKKPCEFYKICEQDYEHWKAAISMYYEEKDSFNPMKDKESLDEVLKEMDQSEGSIKK